MSFLKIAFITLSLFSLTWANEVKKRRAIPKLPEKPKMEMLTDQKILERVDPHGKQENKPTHEVLQKTNECLVCHTLSTGPMTTKPLKNETCFNCHNQSPHSGIEEHLKHKISCIDCHSIHRGQSIEVNDSSSSTLWNKPQHKEIEAGLINKKASFPMLKKNCTDCHK